jgi:phosphoserine phosphatase
LLDEVGTAVVINPSRRLAALARDKGWRIERWRQAVEAGPHEAGA